MILVEHCGVVGQAALEIVLDLLIIGVEAEPTVSGENPLRVGINHKAGQPAGVEQDRIGRFRADAVDFQQLAPQLAERRAKHRLDRTIVAIYKELQQAPQPLGLDAKVSGRLDQVVQFFLGHCVEGMGFEQVGLAEVVDRPGDVLPIGVLHQHGADHHFEGRLARPPVLGAQRVQEAVIDVVKDHGRGQGQGSGDRKASRLRRWGTASSDPWPLSSYPLYRGCQGERLKRRGGPSRRYCHDGAIITFHPPGAFCRALLG